MLTRRGFVVGAVLWPGAAAAAPENPPPLPPPFAQMRGLILEIPDGGDRVLLGDVVGAHPLLVSFWASWCTPCIAEARHLTRLRARYAEEQLAIVGINVEDERDTEAVERFLSSVRPSYTQLWGDHRAYAAFTGEAHVMRLPLCYAYARSGDPYAAFGRLLTRRLDAATAAIVAT